ncbi:non-hydrolyzing UDP-N-acetylglucosamine 2-epimerase [Algoriphagus marinus]|uniref:non-hydrolyzing UDP-N-acetylglucosamine 2-epimerase n=1 Tax=Algoriphagus marinus TaxID=1925762 RepID=UPI00094BB38B|nr:UDP-N-acetylglucosamine 2-epimerase (non-hydrolyzing) [Algoriphagus marinus]
MKKILVVFGTRPEAIKMAPLILEIRKFQHLVDLEICVTGQHRGMLDQVLKLFEIKPDYDLQIMKKEQDLFDVFTNTMMGMREVLKKSSPDLVLVHGDTSSSSAAALSAFYFKIPVGHVEAGLRTYQIYSPWPEEINRQLTGRIATYHFSPTKSTEINLISEGVNPDNIYVTGNTVIDALKLAVEKIEDSLKEGDVFLSENFPEIHQEKLLSWINHKRKLVLITGHRRENFGKGFINICEAILELANLHPDVDFLYPLHLNPNVRSAVSDVFDSSSLPKNVIFTDPMDYLPFIFLMKQAYIVLTDSGGIQEEAPGLGKPVLVFRDTTERPEAVEAGTVLLVGTEKDKIIEYTSDLLTNEDSYQNMAQKKNPYGDGFAAERIISKILEFI